MVAGEPGAARAREPREAPADLARPARPARVVVGMLGRPQLVVRAVLSAGLVATVYATAYPPFYDYYDWLFQGHVVSVLLFGTDQGTADIGGQYVLAAVPVPNLAAPVAIGALNTVLPIEAAGQLFLAVTVLGFALAHGHLVRTIQGRPTAVELAGFLWAGGFYLYKGYLSYLFALAVAFVLVAALHRALARAGGPTRGQLWSLCGLVTLAYASHLLAYGIGVLAVLVHAFVLTRRGLHRKAGYLVATVLPGAGLAAWYVVVEHGGTGVTLYDSWLDKAISLTETVQWFLRLDPFPPSFPIFWVNLVLGLAVVLALACWVDLRAVPAALATRPVLWLAAGLAALALLLPISMLDELIKPDERFVLPALLLAAAALPYRRRASAPPARALAAGLVAVVLGLHAVEYADVGRRIARVDAATDATIPAGAPLLHLTVPSRYGCAPATGVTVGVPVLKWFGVDHALETGQARINLDETSLVHTRAPGPPSLDVLAPAVADVPASVLPVAPLYPYLQVVACPADLDRVGAGLASTYRPVAGGPGYVIYQRGVL
ncbi:MAG: hypothetical protein L0I76_23580 [Pseudonocardia sp.]|nr:hypothetical protein [Pseudonocardia sp.]